MLSDRTFRILREHVSEIVVVSEREIVAAMRLLIERAKLVVEPSAAVALAALIARRAEVPDRIGLVLSGGNVDLDRLPAMLGTRRDPEDPLLQDFFPDAFFRLPLLPPFMRSRQLLASMSTSYFFAAFLIRVQALARSASLTPST